MKNKTLYKALLKAYNIAEGQFAGIPECCIEAYNRDRTYYSVMRSLPKEEQEKFTKIWDYVPCKECLKKGLGGKPKRGASPIGDAILEIMSKLKEADEKNTNN
jgi:hypothetical protein